MSTTSNSRADLRWTALALLALAACTATRPAIDPDAPAPAVRETKAPRVAAVQAEAPRPDETIEIESATILGTEEVPELLSRLTRDERSEADLVVIDVRTTADIGADARSAYPVIVLNGKPLIETRALDVRRLAAAVERGSLRGENSVTVTVIGESARTSRRAVTVRVP